MGRCEPATASCRVMHSSVIIINARERAQVSLFQVAVVDVLAYEAADPSPAAYATQESVCTLVRCRLLGSGLQGLLDVRRTCATLALKLSKLDARDILERLSEARI